MAKPPLPDLSPRARLRGTTKLSSGPCVDADSMCRKCPPKRSPFLDIYSLKTVPLMEPASTELTKAILAQLYTLNPTSLFS